MTLLFGPLWVQITGGGLNLQGVASVSTVAEAMKGDEIIQRLWYGAEHRKKNEVFMPERISKEMDTDRSGDIVSDPSTHPCIYCAPRVLIPNCVGRNGKSMSTSSCLSCSDRRAMSNQRTTPS